MPRGELRTTLAPGEPRTSVRGNAAACDESGVRPHRARPPRHGPPVTNVPGSLPSVIPKDAMTVPRDREDLVARIDAGETFAYRLFWGHHPPQHGGVNHSCLSQWFVAPFTVEGITYPTAEHWMMAGKARLFGDESSLQKVLAAETPKQAKAIGRRVANFDDAAWRANARGIVESGNLAKFRQHPAMGDFLLGTGEEVLVEAAPRDCIWGIGLKREDARARDPRQWRGKNLLGFALMAVRERLRDAPAADAPAADAPAA